MTDLQVSKVTEAIEQFGVFMDDGIKKIHDACKIFTEVIDVIGRRKGMKLFLKRYPNIPRSAWTRFEAVGRGMLRSELLFNFSQGAKQLRCMPVADQDKYLGEPTEVLTSTGDVLRVSIKDMSRDQAKQVFATDHVRSLSEQKGYLETQRELRATTKVSSVPYVVRGKKLIIHESGLSFTKHQLTKILADMEG